MNQSYVKAWLAASKRCRAEIVAHRESSSIVAPERQKTTGSQNLAPVSVLGSSVFCLVSIFNPKSTRQSLTWGDELQEATRLNEVWILAARISLTYSMALTFTMRSKNCPETASIFRRHRKTSAISWRFRRGSNTFVEWVRIDTVKVVAVANQFGHEDTTLHSRFRGDAEIETRKVLNNQAKRMF